MSNNANLEDNFWCFIVVVVVVDLLRDCGRELGTCRDQAKIMYAWARNAPPTKLPKGAPLALHRSSASLCLKAASVTYTWSRWVNALIWNIIKPTLKCSSFADVGFKVGGDTRINYFVLQIHYGDVNNFRGKLSNTEDPEITQQYCEISMFCHDLFTSLFSHFDNFLYAPTQRPVNHC